MNMQEKGCGMLSQAYKDYHGKINFAIKNNSHTQTFLFLREHCSRKGILRPGSDADIVVYDPGLSHVIQAEDCVANVDYNPYEGFVTAGGIREVWLRGRKAVNRGAVLDETPQGRYMARGKCCL